MLETAWRWMTGLQSPLLAMFCALSVTQSSLSSCMLACINLSLLRCKCSDKLSCFSLASLNSVGLGREDEVPMSKDMLRAKSTNMKKCGTTSNKSLSV